MTVQYPDVMIDIETTGTQPDRHAILQIAAVRFNLKENTISHDFFEGCLFMPNNRSWSEETRKWWGRQDQAILQDIMARARDPKEVLTELCEWASPAGQMRFWSKPSHFDYMFLSSYFADYDLPQMFGHSEATDVRSFIRGLHQDPEAQWDEPKVQGGAHNALNDCLQQIGFLFEEYNKTKMVTVNA